MFETVKVLFGQIRLWNGGLINSNLPGLSAKSPIATALYNNRLSCFSRGFVAGYNCLLWN